MSSKFDFPFVLNSLRVMGEYGCVIGSGQIVRQIGLFHRELIERQIYEFGNFDELTVRHNSFQ